MPDNARPESPATSGPGAAPGPPILSPPIPPGRSLDPSTQAPGAPSPARPATTTTGPGSAPPTASPADLTPEVAQDPGPLKSSPTRTSAAYFAVGLSLLILVLVIIFIAQNGHQDSVHFLSFHFQLALGLLVLAAAVAGGLVVLMVSLARVVQLRLMARRHRKAHDRS